MGDASTTAAPALVSSGEAAATAAAEEDRREEVVQLLGHEGNGSGNGGGGDGGSALSANNSAEDNKAGENNVEDGGDRSNNYGGNRWPRPETLALLKIRSDMGAAFRDSSLKAPLWEEVSRKLAELGYKRSAKKCKEKFENVYKYHKRTKDGRTGKSDGKTYRFFDQLEAFEQNHHPPPSQKPHQTITTTTAATTPTPWAINPPISTSASPNIFLTPNPTITTNITPFPPPNSSLPTPQTIITNITTTNKSKNDNGLKLSSPTSSSSTASDEEFQARHKRKRKWRHFFRRLTRELIRKQEEMQKRFLETVGKCEEERTAREEAWRLQEMARINREHEILLQERAAATAKDAAVVSFLQKVSASITTGHNNIDNILSSLRDNNLNFSTPPPPPPPPPAAVPESSEKAKTAPRSLIRNSSITTSSSNSSSRWPKAEIEALINLRTNLDLKYQEKIPKGPLWEEISAGMRQLGYDRSAKRCKEKWENINKYFKKLKDSNKKRSDDSKTCPYFNKLAAIYGEGSKNVGTSEKVVPLPLPLQRFGMEPLMVQPERQWPVQETERNDMVLKEDEEEEEEYEGDEEDHRETSSTTEMEEDHDDHHQGTDIRSSMDMVE